MNKSYHIQNGCHNCELCYIHQEQDCGPQYFCTVNAPPRPENYWATTLHYEPFDLKKADKYYDDWDDWTKDRKVEPWGKCDSWGWKS